MFRHLPPLDDLSRRQFLARTAQACLGVSTLPLAAPLGTALAASAPGGKAKQVIYLFMEGAMSHLDTFDPKPGSDVQGSTKTIQTAVPGIQVSEHFPRLAKQMQRLALVRSLTAETGAHAPGQYLMRTSYKEIASIRHPGLGAWSQKILGKQNAELPGNVVVGNGTGHPGPGFLEARVAPVPIGDPAAGLQNTQSPKYLLDKQFDRRMRLTAAFDQPFEKKYDHREVKAYTELYQEAIKLLKSPELKAFDITAEKEDVRSAYGDNPLGQGCLLARRLVESGVRFVEVVFSGWDMHREVFDEMPGRGPLLDQALSTLLADLEARGFLSETLVAVATEFGRTPKINENAGRDHHPGAFTCLLAGGGIQGGRTYGESDANGFSVKSDRASGQDFNATIAAALGLPLDQEFRSPSGRPFKVAHEGKPLKGLL
ncbi:MAG: DUF1501 domain-containing protein [Pirellulaceae bacterium]|nr:DUF1501 domain-containing protein [Pirellulaceae bacterium]